MAEASSVEIALQAMEHMHALTSQPGWTVLMNQLSAEADEATQALVDTPAHNIEKIQELQNIIKRYHWFRDTPEIIIQTGVNELENAEQEEAETEDEMHDG